MSKPLPVTSPAAISLDPRVYDRGLSCVHCGLCLPACPTYTENGLEADSPRGRIQLMLGLQEGKIAATENVRHHLDLCLDCRACETACPSKVVYHELIEETRAQLGPAKQDASSRLVRWMFLHVLTKPTRLKLALFPARLLQRLGIYSALRQSGLFKRLPPGLRKMEAMLPETGDFWPGRLPRRTFPANAGRPIRNSEHPTDSMDGTRISRLETWNPSDGPTAHFFPGCVGSVMAESLNRKAIQLLAAAGCAVLASPQPLCCGAIHHHNGLHDQAAEMARRIIDAIMPVSNDPNLPADYSQTYIVTPVAGCGAMLREFDLLLRDEPAYAARAAHFVARVRDITELLAELKLSGMTHSVDLTATYHDACHLVHAQQVAQQPRSLLSKVPGLTLIPLAESDMCCGAAGTYNLTQPEMAGNLATRKLRHIEATGATVCIAGNIGCTMHLASAARTAERPIRFVHPVEILYQSVFGESE